MKVYSVNHYDTNNNVGFKSAGKMTRYGMGALITASSLFMFSNAVDSLDYGNKKNSLSLCSDITASIFGIVGTYMSFVGMEKEDDEEGSGKNRYR